MGNGYCQCKKKEIDKDEKGIMFCVNCLKEIEGQEYEEEYQGDESFLGEICRCNLPQYERKDDIEDGDFCNNCGGDIIPPYEPSFDKEGGEKV